ncbi:MAG: hypothetical protein C4518_10355 [Desulfobacteraceae bacterium]|nr:MAG: hypothetical protein C4518_10355 [Desulfobacteraceae bacterium]
MNFDNREINAEKKNCKKCNAEILVTTYERFKGHCAPCSKKINPWEKAKNAMGIFGEITSGIFGAILGAAIGYAIFGIWGAIIGGVLLSCIFV